MGQIKVIRSKRRTIALTVDDELNVIVRAPFLMPDKVINSFIKQNEKWIEKQTEKKRQYIENHPPLTKEQEAELKKAALEILPQKVKHYAEIMGVSPTGIKITSAKKRFGSCSGKNSLCFSFMLMQYPEEAVDYVVVHELAHIRHHNHSRDFYRFIEKYMPDYKEREKLLKK